jgi:hypothetical protein
MADILPDIPSECLPIDSVKPHLGNQNAGQADEIGWSPNLVFVEKTPIRLVLKAKSLNLSLRIRAKESVRAGRAKPCRIGKSFVPSEPTFPELSMELYET